MGLFSAVASLAKNTVLLPVDVTRDVLLNVLDEPNGPTKTEQRAEKLEDEFLEKLDDDESL
jgi:hypothetical protein